MMDAEGKIYEVQEGNTATGLPKSELDRSESQREAEDIARLDGYQKALGDTGVLDFRLGWGPLARERIAKARKAKLAANKFKDPKQKR